MGLPHVGTLHKMPNRALDACQLLTELHAPKVPLNPAPS